MKQFIVNIRYIFYSASSNSKVHTDHSGSIVDVRDVAGNVVYRVNYDAWGRERNPNAWDYTPNPYSRPPWLIRGYTGHGLPRFIGEMKPEFGLINMNGRLYDPVICRMLSPDNFVQDATSTQGYNRYTYVLNNPLKYKDESGENPLLIAAGVYFLFFTEQGYDIQKYLSPVAVKIDLTFGTHQRGIGIQTSIGIPQVLPLSARVHGSIGYYWKNYSVPEGWQFTYGYEVGITPFFVTGSTNYITPSSPEFNQRLWHARIGLPMLNIKYENDYSFGLPFGDGGDRYRTAAGRIEIGPFAAGFNLFTGDPGLDPSIREKGVDPQTGRITYKKNKYGNDPDKYRHGVAYFELLGLKFGKDSENIRHNIQNKLAHDKLKPGTPWFKVLNIKETFYFQFGSGGGYLW